LWYHFRCENHPDIDTPANKHAAEKLELEELIVYNADKTTQKTRWSLTEKGNFFVSMLCMTPLPIMEWRDPREN